MDEAANFLGFALAECRGKACHELIARDAEDLGVAVGGPDRPALVRPEGDEGEHGGHLADAVVVVAGGTGLVVAAGLGGGDGEGGQDGGGDGEGLDHLGFLEST